MVEFTVLSKHETLLSLYGCKKYKDSLNKDKIYLERNFENCATNPVKMNYRLAFVVSYERIENALIYIISIGPSTKLRPIFNYPTFHKNETLLELLNIVFENSLPNGFFWSNKKKSKFFDLAPDSRYLQTMAKSPDYFKTPFFKLIYCQSVPTS